jgi:hypothetical protein
MWLYTIESSILPVVCHSGDWGTVFVEDKIAYCL